MTCQTAAMMMTAATLLSPPARKSAQNVDCGAPLIVLQHRNERGGGLPQVIA
jgi:hypothetical protein